MRRPCRSCRDFPMAHLGGRRSGRICRGAAEMPRLFVDYVGMGDSDKPKDYPYCTAERTNLVEAIWRDLGVQSTTLVAFDFSSLVVLEHLRRRLERSEPDGPPDGPDIRGVFIFNGGSLRTGTPTRGTPRRCCAASPSGPAAAWAAPSRCSRGCQA